MICAVFFVFFFFTLGTGRSSRPWPFCEESRAFDLGFSTKCWLLVGFGKAFRKNEMLLSTEWDAFCGASGCCCVGHGASKNFLFPTLSLVVVTPLYVSHSFSSLVADRLTKD
jgi:hypothetical protein